MTTPKKLATDCVNEIVRLNGSKEKRVKPIQTAAKQGLFLLLAAAALCAHNARQAEANQTKMD